jgi:TetR/AcrR family transcriptional repressor of lmrAB and yxaGH operons
MSPMTIVIGETLAEEMTVVIGVGYDACMQEKDQGPVPRRDRRRSPARARMVQSAATLMRERGIHGVGLREVVAHSGGPRGSLGRYFPGGKTQLMSEAIDVALADLYDELERTVTEARTFPEAIGLALAPWRGLLLDSEFGLGCPLAATVVDASANDKLRVHVSDLLARWQGTAAQIYIRFGASPTVADEHATVLLSALEGALILARAHRSMAPLDTVERYFAARAPSATD